MATSPKEAYTGDGEMVNSEFLNGYTNKKDSIQQHAGRAETPGHWPCRRSVQDERLGIQPSEILGRADSDRSLPALR